MRTTGLFLVLASVLLAAPATAQTQITTAVIEGIVTDQSGAALPGVSIEVRNNDTNLARTLVSDHEGRFVALQLPPGRYTVTLKLSGFSTWFRVYWMMEMIAHHWRGIPQFTSVLMVGS